MKKNSESRFKTLKIFIELLPFLWVKDRKIQISIWLSLCLTIIMIALNVSIPLIFKNIINILSAPAKSSYAIVHAALLLYGSLWTISQIVSQLRSILMFQALERGTRVLSLRIFDQLHALCLRFHLERRTGAVTSSIERAQFGFETIFWGLLLFILPTSIEMFLVISLLTYFYGIFYSGVLLLIMICYLVFSVLAINRSAKKQNFYNEKRSHASARIVDSLLNFETVKYFNNERHDHEQCDKILQEQENAGTSKDFADAFVQLGQGIVIGLGLLYVTLISGNAVISGRMNIGDFVLINGYLLQFAMPLHQFGYILRQVRNGLNDMNGIIELITLKPEIQDAPDAIELKINNAITTFDITFDTVAFSYDKQRQIFNDISFTIPAGKTVAIVGPTGTGKSTIARLLFRFYDVSNGRILINGHDIRNITQQSLHAAIGVVPQDTVLFNNTLYYNVAYGRPTASQQEVEHAIKLSHLDEFIKTLPDGYNTMVGERGLKLSGGEKQRVAIARVLLKRPAIYIFDEATSSLDTHTEQEIQRNIEEIFTGATTLIIAHRLSTVIHADEILVLNHGLITERGTHQSLLILNGVYAALWHNYKINTENLSNY
ncbi:MAG: ABC transporter ATP-binding protein/permease [bacterium]